MEKLNQHIRKTYKSSYPDLTKEQNDLIETAINCGMGPFPPAQSSINALRLTKIFLSDKTLSQKEMKTWQEIVL